MHRADLAAIIADRLTADIDVLGAQFSIHDQVHTGYFIVADLLPGEVVREIHDAFPDHRRFRRLDTFCERKSTSKSLDELPRILTEITFAFQDRRVVDAIERITGIRDQHPDPYLYAGGLSAMVRGDFLNPHIDNSHDNERRLYRTVNLLYYVTPNWSSQSGGNFELWDRDVRRRVEVVSAFNRLLVMETNVESWHSVNEVRDSRPRCCVSNYYFSPNPPGDKHHFHVTTFSARPEQPIRRLVAKADATLRTAVRVLKRRGIARQDLYAR